MTPLSAVILELLQAEANHPPLSAESLSRVLWVTGYGKTETPIPLAAIEAALAELMRDGTIERIHSARLGERYRAIQPARPVSSPSHEGDRST